jgi:hypothetical protein
MPAALEFGMRVRGEHKKQKMIPLLSDFVNITPNLSEFITQLLTMSFHYFLLARRRHNQL